MSLFVKEINYITVHLSTPQDLKVFTKELEDLLESAYTVSLGLFATNTDNATNINSRLDFGYAQTRRGSITEG